MSTKKLGIPGILEIDRETGTILFHADPRYVLCASPVVLKVTGLPTPVPDPTSVPLEIRHLMGQNWEAAPTSPLVVAPPVVPAGEKALVPRKPINFQVTDPHVPGAYADILYPKEILEVMHKVLAGQWSGPDPEKLIDQRITLWMQQNVPDAGTRGAYIASLLSAVKARGCAGIVLARLNAALLMPDDAGDTIVIKSNRRFRLPGEGVPPGHYLEGLPQMSLDAYSDESIEPKDLYGGSFNLAEQFYGSEEVIQVRVPEPSLSAQARDLLWQRLRQLEQAGLVSLAPDVGAAMERLEKLLHGHDLEQSVLARLVYLAIFNVVRAIDGRVLLSRLWPALASTEISGLVGKIQRRITANPEDGHTYPQLDRDPVDQAPNHAL